jgi:two-component system CheB/CheR fusion protein
MPESRPPPDLPAGEEPKAADFSVVGIGASAGGLDACWKLMDGIQGKTGLACILVQHLDPDHESHLVDLLTGHTAMTVKLAEEGMSIEPEHVYVIPPGVYLFVRSGRLYLSEPTARRGARLPFDFLLLSLAAEYGPRAICVVLSGTGEDGCNGIRAIRKQHGLTIAQDPNEASYDGMPRSAIKTGLVDLVLPVSDIPGALISRAGNTVPLHTPPARSASNALTDIVTILREKTSHNFALYKDGTLQRRIARRATMAGIPENDMDRYAEVLRNAPKELDRLAADLLINVTSFFRDAKVFATLAEQIVPDLVINQPADRPLRIWIAGCSTGEEAYSLAMLFHEQIEDTKSNIKLQFFASDADAEAVATARDGLYPDTIEADVSPDRLERFFLKEGPSYRIAPRIRQNVVFAVQDVLADPPFSRLDMISCRNLLIYLLPEAQERVISQFHFALQDKGILLLGNSESIGRPDGSFESLSKADRIYRNLGRGNMNKMRGPFGMSNSTGSPQHRGAESAAITPAALAELCRRLVIENYAPAAVLINRKHECLFSLGPTDRYLRVSPGHAANDILTMAREGVRAKLKAAILESERDAAPATVSGGRIDRNGRTFPFGIAVRPVSNAGEELFLVCFLDEPVDLPRSRPATGQAHPPRVAELEHELEAAKAELQRAVRELDVAGQEQRVMNEEASSVNEEYQSTNEELLTSKEELQSLNEELTALNSQLHETLDRQRTLSNDLQNILYSTEVATIFLDLNLNIRFFTPTTKLLFNVIPGDVGRPLTDLSSLAEDAALLADAKAVLQTPTPVEREVEARNGAWYNRRVLPYRTLDGAIAGVVITFSDITERRQNSDALADAERDAQRANIAKSRFLAAASHDLRQPMQALALLQGLLAKTVQGERAQKLVARLDDAIGAMSGMLNTLLDINQIEAGTIRKDVVSFSIDTLLKAIVVEFGDQARAQHIGLRSVPSSVTVRSDPALLGQMLRNLLSNALKYTTQGKVLIGCRRHGDQLSIEIWDTGIGIPEEELQAIFQEYHQLGNTARERSHGIGLGLSIVQRLGAFLGHRVRVRSRLGKGSVFTVEVAIPPPEASSVLEPQRLGATNAAPQKAHRTGVILVVEDDPEVRDLMTLYLKGEGHRIATAPDGDKALEYVARGDVRPDVILADYNLPGEMDGLQVIAKLRDAIGREIPAVILTGDISTATLQKIAQTSCVQLNKPVRLGELTQHIQLFLPDAPKPPPATDRGPPGKSVVFVVDDDPVLREAFRETLESAGHPVEDYESCEAFLAAYRPGREECLLIDAYLPGMSGLELLEHLREAGHKLPAVMITGNSDVSVAVYAMKAGATDFIEKPVGASDLLAIVARALEQSRDATKQFAWREDAAAHIADLTPRQREIMEMVLAGHPSKNIAADLNISQRTVENHRAAIMKRTGSKSLPALARLALAATT